MTINTLYHAAVIAAAAVIVTLAFAASYLWPIPAAITATHLLCAAAGLLIGHRGRKVTTDVCDMLTEEVVARKLADQRHDTNCVRIETAWARRRARALPPLPMPAGITRPEIVVGPQ